MATIIPFTNNYRDLSNDRGFQFEFVCERCGNGYRSPFQSDKVAMGTTAIRGFSRLASGRMRNLGYATDAMVNRSTNSPAKDKALGRAVETVRDQFRQCRGCGRWVCAPVCWNHDIGQCLQCSPSVVDEMSRAQAAAQVEQIKARAQDTDWTAELDLTNRTVVRCPSCQAETEGGKFCPSCGSPLRQTTTCATCGSQLRAGARFCSECGTPAS